MLDPRINTFISVCNNVSYTKAAKELNLTQPAVSQHIRYLENLYGVRLFKYEKKQLSLTEEGKLLQSIGYTLKSDEELLKKNPQNRQRANRTSYWGDHDGWRIWTH